MTIKFNPKDIWIGLYWTIREERYGWRHYYQFYICIIPCFPVFFEIARSNRWLKAVAEQGWGLGKK